MKLFNKKKGPKLTYRNVNTDLQIMEAWNREHHPELYKQPEHICKICNKTIEGKFETAGNIFDHTEYNWWVVQKHPIIWNSGVYYHWDCFITTEEGKKHQEDLIKNKEKEIVRYNHYNTYRNF